MLCVKNDCVYYKEYTDLSMGKIIKRNPKPAADRTDYKSQDQLQWPLNINAESLSPPLFVR